MAKKKAPEKPSASPDAAPGAPASAEYTVLARRYRPQQFDDLVGQEPVAQALVNAIKTNRVAHAYLFTGARGVGKTSAARILAKALNCEKGPTPTPCDQCDMCRAIMSGDDTDVLEIDAASNTGVDNVREIRANVQYRPSKARYRVYIIDEVHMLSTAAFNALLKTLEEPPPHVKFIFATTEVQKIPVTILSRCQRFDFAGISLAKIRERLREIVAGEKMQADDEALDLIARRAGGSMRDAQSLLDQLLAFGGAKLDASRVHELLGTAHEERVASLAAAVSERDAKRALGLLEEMVEQGQQLGELLDQLIEYWRDLLVVACAGVENQALTVSSKYRDVVAQQAKKLSDATILAGLDILVAAKGRLRFTSHARILLEMALVRLCRLDDLVSLSQLAQALGPNGQEIKAGPTASATRPVAATPPVSSPSASAEKKKVDEPSPNGESNLVLTNENLAAFLQQLIADSGFTIGGELRRVISLAISAPNSLVFRFPERYNQRSDQVLEGTRRTELADLIAKITGQRWEVRVELVAEPTNGSHAATSEPPAEKARRQRTEVMKMPLVEKAMTLLGAQVVGVDEGFGQTAAAPAAPPDGSIESETGPSEPESSEED